MNKDRVWLDEHAIEITETEVGGQGTCFFRVPCQTLALRPKSNLTPVTWANETKCADAALLVLKGNGIDLHLVEMKSQLTIDEWARARRQFYGIYLSALALRGILDLPTYSRVTCYLAYTSDVTSNRKTANAVLLKTKVGGGKTFSGVEDWVAGCIHLTPNLTVNVIKLQRDSSGNAYHSIAPH